jgi:DNA-directed RNA polymerase subunit alpha
VYGRTSSSSKASGPEPDHLIAVLDKKGPLSMELTVNVGRGYVPAERNKTPTMPIGTIPIDALFSPIRKVNYTVQNARVGQVTDYDKLTLEVWTNGSVRPRTPSPSPRRS